MNIIHYLKSAKFVENASALVIGSLGIFINALYFTFVYFERTGNIIGQVGAKQLEYALILATIPLYLTIGRLYLHEKKTSKKLDTSNKTKDLFIDIMRHDLFNPAGVAMNLAEMAQKDEEDPDKKVALDMIFNSSKRVIDLIESASKIAKIDSEEELEFNEDDLGSILRSVIKDMTHLADDKKTKITFEAKGKFKAKINPLIYDVFSNLIGNAIKYGPDNSEVVLGIENDGHHWKISVADRGEGVADEYKETIFTRFERVHKGGVKGTGLGLTIVKKVIKVHKGRVWVEDNPGGGSIFYITLPKK